MRLPRLPLLALAFGAGAGVLGPVGTPGQAMLLAGPAMLLALTAAGPGPRARLVMVVMLAGAARMAVERLDVEQPPRLPPGVAADDRALDTLSGAVRGPVEQGPDGCAFALDLDRSEARVWISVRDMAARERATGCARVLPGDRVRVHGRLRAPGGYRVPGGFDARRLAAVRGTHYALSARDVSLRGPGASPWRWPGRAQRWAAARIASQERDARAVAVARAMIAGDRGGLDRALSERFRDAGVAHVLAVSGLHLAVVALLVFAAVRRGWAAVPALAMRVAPARAAALVAAPAAVAFTLLTGARVSTVRALLVVLLVLAGAATDRRARVVDALGAAALVLLWVQPFALYDPSFQLSFAATATLALALGGQARPPDAPAGVVMRLLRRGLCAVRGLLRASLWATLATAPFTALAFGSVATGGLLANLAVVPLAELVIVPVGLLGLALAGVWHAAGGLLLDVAVIASGWVAAVAELTAGIAPVPRVPPPRIWELGACGLIWIAAICGLRGWWPRRTALALAGLGVVVIGVSHAHAAWLGPAWRQDLRVTFLDVGQGDAAVLELPGGAVWMIDAGGLPFVSRSGAMSPAERQRLMEMPGERAVLPFLAARRIERIDIAVITHPHPDHYEGMRAVAREVDIGALWVARPPPGDRHAPSYQALLAALRSRGTRIVHPRLDTSLAHRGVVMSVLAPRYLDRTSAMDPVMGLNDNSLVVRVDFAGRAALFTGDIEREGEELLVARHGRGLGADLVKVPHHGSATSSTPALVRATGPRWAVISCGVANRFRFPAPRVVARWHEIGAAVLRTDRHGAITWTVAPDGAMSVAVFEPP